MENPLKSKLEANPLLSSKLADVFQASEPTSQSAGGESLTLGTASPGLGEKAQMTALEIKSRILSGEKVDLATLKTFLAQADEDLGKIRAKRNKPDKPTDVDFF